MSKGCGLSPQGYSPWTSRQNRSGTTRRLWRFRSRDARPRTVVDDRGARADQRWCCLGHRGTHGDAHVRTGVGGARRRGGRRGGRARGVELVAPVPRGDARTMTVSESGKDDMLVVGGGDGGSRAASPGEKDRRLSTP